RVPELRLAAGLSPIAPDRGDGLAVRAEGQPEDRAGVTLKGQELAAARDLPDLDGPGLVERRTGRPAADGEPTTVGTERHAEGEGRRVAQGLDRLATG